MLQFTAAEVEVGEGEWGRNCGAGGGGAGRAAVQVAYCHSPALKSASESRGGLA